MCIYIRLLQTHGLNSWVSSALSSVCFALCGVRACLLLLLLPPPLARGVSCPCLAVLGPQDAVRIFSRTYNTGDIARPHCVWEVSGRQPFTLRPQQFTSGQDRQRSLACLLAHPSLPGDRSKHGSPLNHSNVLLVPQTQMFLPTQVFIFVGFFFPYTRLLYKSYYRNILH